MIESDLKLFDLAQNTALVMSLWRLHQTFGLALNLTLADFCLLGFLTMRSVMLRDFVQRGLVVQNIPPKRISDAMSTSVSQGNRKYCPNIFYASSMLIYPDRQNVRN